MVFVRAGSRMVGLKTVDISEPPFLLLDESSGKNNQIAAECPKNIFIYLPYIYMRFVFVKDACALGQSDSILTNYQMYTLNSLVYGACDLAIRFCYAGMCFRFIVA